MAAWLRVEPNRFWASFQLSLRTNLSIERKSGNESKQSDAITHIYIHIHERGRNRVSYGCLWNGKLIRSSVDLFKVYSHSLVCVWVCACVFIFFVRETRFREIRPFSLLPFFTCIVLYTMNVWPSSISFRWLCALSICYTAYMCCFPTINSTQTHRMYSHTLGCQIINEQNHWKNMLSLSFTLSLHSTLARSHSRSHSVLKIFWIKAFATNLCWHCEYSIELKRIVLLCFKRSTR